MTQVLSVLFQIGMLLLQLQTQNISVYRLLAINPNAFNSLGMLGLNLSDLITHLFPLTIDPGFLLSPWTVP